MVYKITENGDSEGKAFGYFQFLELNKQDMFIIIWFWTQQANCAPLIPVIVLS